MHVKRRRQLGWLRKRAVKHQIQARNAVIFVIDLRPTLTAKILFTRVVDLLFFEMILSFAKYQVAFIDAGIG